MATDTVRCPGALDPTDTGSSVRVAGDGRGRFSAGGGALETCCAMSLNPALPTRALKGGPDGTFYVLCCLPSLKKGARFAFSGQPSTEELPLSSTPNVLALPVARPQTDLSPLHVLFKACHLFIAPVAPHTGPRTCRQPRQYLPIEWSFPRIQFGLRAVPGGACPSCRVQPVRLARSRATLRARTDEETGDGETPDP